MARKISLYVLILVSCCVAFVPLSSIAQESKVEQKKTEEQAPNPVFTEAEKFTKTFNEADKRHFYLLFSNYNMTKVVGTVESDVGVAVEKCGQANPDLKAPLANRYKAWSEAIAPIMTESKANIDNMILVQSYAKPADIRKFFGLIDEARNAKDKEVNKVPVTSKEACEYLLKTMDKTQPQMVKLLEATLINLPRAMQAEREEKAQQKEETPKPTAQ